MHTPSVGATEGSDPAHGTWAVGLLCLPSDSETETMKIVFALCLGQNSYRFTLLPRSCLVGDPPPLGCISPDCSCGERPSKKLESKRNHEHLCCPPTCAAASWPKAPPPGADGYPILSSPASSCNFDLWSPSCFERVSWPRVEKQVLLWKQAAYFVY